LSKITFATHLTEGTEDSLGVRIILSKEQGVEEFFKSFENSDF